VKDQILKVIDSPHDLEVVYRGNPKEFTRVFPQVFAEYPDSSILQAWHERLFYTDQAESNEQATPTRGRATDIGLTVTIAFIAGTLAKLPHIIPMLNEEQFYMRNLGGIVIGALILYFCIQKRCAAKVITTIMAVLFAVLLYLNLLPDASNSDSIVLANLHMPFALWSLLCIAFLSGMWGDLRGRMDYIRYNGELLIYSTVILIGGMVLTGLTFALFELIDLSIEEWYLKNVVVYGAVASPIVATLLITEIVGKRFKIAPLLAKVFTPLFLLTVVAYLLAMAINHRSPFTDRDFLIAFNGLLLVVLGLCVFSISERSTKQSVGVVDIMNIGLVAVTLIIDVIALAAIIFRLSSYGFTPNRLAVLGGNLLAFCHLAGILYSYTRFASKRGSFESIENWIVKYIPAYTVWSVCVAVGFPLIFWFK
jgi:hypothetical protein